jgi:two-component system, chemotaxis family, response regulator Rcp1
MESTQHYRTIDILLAEDNPGDVRLVKELLNEGKVLVNVTAVSNGVEVIEYLRDNNNTQPDIILLDLNLPRKNGMEVLAEIKNDFTLKRIPVIMLTTSAANEDIVRCYNLNVNAFLTKPVDLDEYIALIRTFEAFWLTAVQLPSRIS